MWTQGQVVVLNAGASIDLDCEFYSDAFNMFNNPVVWKKHQRHEQTEVNIMGNILAPFLQQRTRATASSDIEGGGGGGEGEGEGWGGANRFLVTFTNNAPRYRLRLRVDGTHE